ncbi:protein kinase [Myxococcota bacterium]|nr:protein kinase [Myxococcota bacterium]
MSQNTITIGTKLGNYRLQKLIGEGQMGQVYLAWDEALERETAVKILSWKIQNDQGLNPIDWFLNEARQIAKVNHPGVIQIFSAAKHKGIFYIAMEYVEGKSAETIIEEEGKFEPIRATEIFASAASALHAAHSRNIIHRDIKSANFLINKIGQVKLGDFGMAIDQNVKPSELSMRVGTPYNIATELWEGKQASILSDIYSLGATFYHMLTGKHPYPADDIESLMKMHLNAPPPNPNVYVPNLPQKCFEIIECCLAKSPQDRYQSAQEVSWAARGLLRILSNNIESYSIQNDPGQTLELNQSDVESQQSSIKKAFKKATIRWKQFGFHSLPFSDANPSEPPYEGPPFSKIWPQLIDIYNLKSFYPIILLTGQHGSGRSFTAIKFLSLWKEKGAAFYIECSHENQSLISTLRYLVEAKNESEGLSDLIDRFEVIHRKKNQPTLVIIDHLFLRKDGVSKDLKILFSAAEKTGLFIIVLVSDLESRSQLNISIDSSIRSESVLDLKFEPLNLEEMEQYLKDWLKATSDINSKPFILSKDAKLLLHHFAAGNLAEINRIALNMLMISKARGDSVIRSWQVWVAAKFPGRADTASKAISKEEPASWPPPEAFKVINLCRIEHGLPPLSPPP